MQNYYGMAIRKNSGNLIGMQNHILAIYHHMINANSFPLSEQHKYCPKGSGSWCKYWKDRCNGSNTYCYGLPMDAIMLVLLCNRDHDTFIIMLVTFG